MSRYESRPEYASTFRQVPAHTSCQGFTEKYLPCSSAHQPICSCGMFLSDKRYHTSIVIMSSLQLKPEGGYRSPQPAHATMSIAPEGNVRDGRDGDFIFSWKSASSSSRHSGRLCDGGWLVRGPQLTPSIRERFYLPSSARSKCYKAPE